MIVLDHNYSSINVYHFNVAAGDDFNFMYCSGSLNMQKVGGDITGIVWIYRNLMNKNSQKEPLVPVRAHVLVLFGLDTLKIICFYKR